MPIYEYTCGKCHNHFEHLHKRIEETDPVSCPECGSIQTKRTLSIFSVGAGATPETCCADSPDSCLCCCGHGPSVD